MIDVQRTDKNLFSPIGADVFFLKGQVRARFIQQPVEAYATISACLEAYQLTHDPFWLEEAKRANQWFFGVNDTQHTVITNLGNILKEGDMVFG